MPEYKRAKDIFDLLDHMAGADLSLPERAVLVQQYKYADRDGRNSYVSEKRLADDLFTTDKTIRNHRQKLRAKTWLIERSRGKNIGGEKASAYDVVIPLFQKPARRAKRKANNVAGWNQHRKNSSCESEEDLTSNPSSPQEEIFHLPTDQETDAVRRASDDSVVAGDDPHVQSGLPQAAPGSGSGIAVGGEPSGQHVAGTDSGSAEVSNANKNDPPPQDPWGPAPTPARRDREHRYDLDEEFA